MAAAGADIRPLRGRCDRDADLASRIALVSALVQTLVPDWARARVLAVFILTCQGGLAAGSATWGVVATRIGIPATLVIAGLSTLATIAMCAFRKLPDAIADTTPWNHWRLLQSWAQGSGQRDLTRADG